MGFPDHKAAERYAIDCLKNLHPNLLYHSLAHTCEIVVPAVERLAAMEGLDDVDLDLLRTAAFFHDIGFVHQYLDHEAVGVRIAHNKSVSVAQVLLTHDKGERLIQELSHLYVGQIHLYVINVVCSPVLF